MAKKALLDVLEQTIGKYVRNLDAESLNVAVWSGKIELHSLEVDIDAVNGELDRQASMAPNLAIPFRVCAGKLEKLEVDVPWAHLMSQPVTLRARGLHLAVEAKDITSSLDPLYKKEVSEIERSRRLESQRLHAIERADDFRQKSNALAELAAQDLNTPQSKRQQQSTFGARLVRRILENIQIEISDVHISFVDRESSAGVVLESVQLITTDGDGKRAFVDRTVDGNAFLHKALQISGLGIYLDENAKPSRLLSSITEASNESETIHHDYILAPLHLSAKLRQADSNACSDVPKYTLESELPSLVLLLSKPQLESAYKIAHLLQPAPDISRPLFPEYRPLARVTHETAREWWKYAYRCIGRLSGRTLWQEFFKAFRSRKRYIQLYKRKHHASKCPWLSPLTSYEQDELTSIGRDRSISIEGVMLWRNISDAQIKKEREKHAEHKKQEQEHTSLFSSIFGTTSTAGNKPGSEKEEMETPPISLSPEELKEMENAALQVEEESELTGKLCDIRFALGSFRVHLSSYGLRQLSSLDMGKVSTQLQADVDGSFSLNFLLSSLEIHDKVTHNTLFPSVIRNHDDVELTGSEDAAFCVHLEKTASGDQKLNVVLRTFEIVASPLLLVELYRFGSVQNVASSSRSSTRNPILAQSLSGSVDLFYDATEGVHQPILSQVSSANTVFEQPAGQDTDRKPNFSMALVNAWKAKTSKRSSLVIHLDLKAPVLVLPENCIEAHADVLVFHLGHLQLQHGGCDSSLNVLKWFKDNPLEVSETGAMPVLEHGILRIDTLTFLVGKVSTWRQLLAEQEGPTVRSGNSAILGPISVSIDYAVEDDTETPRGCAFAVVPSISVGISLGQAIQITRVGNAWRKRQFEFFPASGEPLLATDPGDRTGLFTRSSSQRSSFDIAATAERKVADAKKGVSVAAQPTATPFSRFFLQTKLQRVSFAVRTGKGPVVEAYLVSVSCSVLAFSDGSSESRLTMGWFWIIDRLENSSRRNQRLFAHSSLPSADLECDDNYDIMGRIENLGVFSDIDDTASTELADIVFKQSGIWNEENDFESCLHVKFSSLFVNWNPLSVGEIASELQSFQSSLESSLDFETPLIVSAENPPRSPTAGFSSVLSTRSLMPKRKTKVKIELASNSCFQLCLNSAKDDLPLFFVTMTGAEITCVSFGDDNRETSIVLGNLTITSPSRGRTNPLYRTVLGLSPGQVDSLLRIRFCEGSRCVSMLCIEGLLGVEAYGRIELSSMKLVYIHSQVIALVEYATAGILGALAVKAATSAVEAAAEIATPSRGRKIFRIEAGNLEVVLPRAAYRPNAMLVNSGTLRIDYETQADLSSMASMVLEGCEFRDSKGGRMQRVAIRTEVAISLPPEDVGSKDDQAMRVSISMEDADFILPSREYTQLLATLTENIGDTDLYLREDEWRIDDATGKVEKLPEMTHAGIEFVDNPRRLYLEVDIGALSLELASAEDSIVKISGVNASIRHKIYSDEDRTSSTITLQNLICDDLRERTLTRQYRSLIYQFSGEKQAEDVFSLLYEKDGDLLTTLDISVGSPCVVLIPDAVAEILTYLDDDAEILPPAQIAKSSEYEHLNEEREVNDESPGRQKEGDSTSLTTSISLKTSRCRVILVDLGTDSLLQTHAATSSSQVVSVAESVVFEGRFEAQVTVSSDVLTKEIEAIDAEIHGEQLESYTAFGQVLDSALQIIEPTKLSLYFRQKMRTEPCFTKEMDLRCAAMEPIDVSLSMKNIALLNAILASISVCFDGDEVDPEPGVLDPFEAQRIATLASALEVDETDQFSQNLSPSTHSNLSSFAGSERLGKESAATKMALQLTAPGVKLAIINDLQGLDEPLFRIKARNTVANTLVYEADSAGNATATFTAFDFNTHVSLVADFFDHSTNSWQPMLLKPWEVSCKGHRGRSEKYESIRPSTTIDIECFPCYLSFSEQFLMRLASANQMWHVYSTATECAVGGTSQSKQLRRSLAASAARKFVASLPYAVENHSGETIEFIVGDRSADSRVCASGSLEYFRFEPPRGKGSAGKRKYGQDTSFQKNLRIAIGGTSVLIPNLDPMSDTPKHSHALENGKMLVVEIVQEGKTTVIHLSSGIEIENYSSVSFSVCVVGYEKHSLGVCEGQERHSKASNLTRQDGTVYRKSRQFGVPAALARDFWRDWQENNCADLCLMLSPVLDDSILCHGIVDVALNATMLKLEGSASTRRSFDVTCRPDIQGTDHFIFKASLLVEMVDGQLPSVKVVLEPRATLENYLPVSISVRSPMPHIYGAISDNDPDVFDLPPMASIEIFTPGPSIAVMMKITDFPVGGSATGWIDGGWLDLPLMTEFRLLDPLRCILPFTRSDRSLNLHPETEGVEFFVSQGWNNLLQNTFAEKAKTHGGEMFSEPREVEKSCTSSEDDNHKFFVTSCFYAVDHTGEILFEELNSIPQDTRRRSFAETRRRSMLQPASAPIGAFATPRHAGRISILPASKPVRLLHLTMEGEDGMRKSMPFRANDVPIGKGGVDSLPILWENGSQSSFFAYRQLVSSHQSEIHVVPEYIVFNGSGGESIRIRQSGGLESLIAPGAISSLRTSSNITPVISIECISSAGKTSPLRVDSLGLRVSIVKKADGTPIGSLAIQTVTGGLDSRLVVKVGELKYRTTESTSDSGTSSLFEKDYLRFRVQWTELRLSMYEARPAGRREKAFLEAALDQISRRHPTGDTWVAARENKDKDNRQVSGPVCTILFYRFTVDWQRVFKEDTTAKQLAFRSPERSQLSVIIHNVLIKDDTPDSPFPVVFDSSTKTSFLDLCIRFKGPLDADLIKVDLFDLRLAHSDNISQKIIIKTSEDFIWKFLDLADRILAAAGEFSGVEIELKWDEEHDGYKVVARDKISSYIKSSGRYSPPKTDTLYDINKARVSPFTIMVSFKRNPNVGRYALKQGVRGANLMNYFTRQLKFHINGAELKFGRYEVNHVKGPPDRLLELLSTVYFSRIKMKMLTILSSASFQDWKELAARNEGDDAFVEGDILRVTGNLVGKTAGLFVRKAGTGLGRGVSLATGALGDGIESGTAVIGLQPVGAGVNSVVSGVGDAAAATITGVGRGSGKVLRGAGKGVGHVFGGVTGGAVKLSKGIGKGIATGDGHAVVSGITDGVTSLGAGVGQGVESVVSGTAEGVISVGHGIFTGARSLGRGFGDAFKGKKASRSRNSSGHNTAI